MNKIRVWSFTANGIGWNRPKEMYFGSRQHAAKAWDKHEYASNIKYMGMFNENKFEDAYPIYPETKVHDGELYRTNID